MSQSMGVSFVAGMPTTKLILSFDGENKVMRIPLISDSNEHKMSFTDLVDKIRARFQIDEAKAIRFKFRALQNS